MYHSILGRQYDPSAGRWTGLDRKSFQAGDPNLYRYVFNSPVNATDPYGTDAYVVKSRGQDYANRVFKALSAIFQKYYIQATGEPYAGFNIPLGNTTLPNSFEVGIWKDNALVRGPVSDFVRRVLVDFDIRFEIPELRKVLAVLDAGLLAATDIHRVLKLSSDGLSLVIQSFTDKVPEPVFANFILSKTEWVKDVEAYGTKITKFYDLLGHFKDQLQGKLPQLFAALTSDPKRIFDNLIGGLKSGFNAFFSIDNMEGILGKVFEWGFGPLLAKLPKDFLETIQSKLPKNWLDFNQVSSFLGEVLRKLSGIENLNWSL